MKKSKKNKAKKVKVKKYDILDDIRQTAFKDGYIKGVKLGIAMRLLERGVDIEIISQATYLTLVEIKDLQSEKQDNE